MAGFAVTSTSSCSNEPSPCFRNSWFCASIRPWSPTPALDVANQSCQTSAMRSTSGRDVRTILSSHQQWSWPQASAGANGRPFESCGFGPTSFSAPGFRSWWTAPSRPSFASAAASPGRGPKPARQSSLSACDAANFPRYTGAPTADLSSAPRATPDHSLEAFPQEHTRFTAPVVVLVHALYLETERLVERDRPLVHRRGDGADDRPRRDRGEEPLVHLPPEPRPPLGRIDPDEVDVRLVGVGL